MVIQPTENAVFAFPPTASLLAALPASVISLSEPTLAIEGGSYGCWEDFMVEACQARKRKAIP